MQEQIDKIIKKAKLLGIQTYSQDGLGKLNEIASQLGLGDFDPESDNLSTIEEMLDSNLNDEDESLDNNQNWDEENVDNRRNYKEDVYSDDVKKNAQEADTNYQGNENQESQTSANNEVKKLKESKDNNTSSNQQTSPETNKNNPLPPKRNSNKFENNKLKQQNNAKSQSNNISKPKIGIKNKLENATNKLNKISHPANSLKEKGKSAVKEGAKKAGKKVAKATGKAAKAVGKAIVKFIASNPYVLLILLAIILVVFLVLTITAVTGEEYDDGSGNGNSTYYEKKCDFNNTEILYHYCNISSAQKFELDDFILDQIALSAQGQIDNIETEKLKALIIAMKTKILSIGNYNSDTQSITINGCNLEHIDYQNITASTYMSVLDEVREYLYISKSVSGTINNLSSENALEVDALNFPEGSNFEEILKTAYQNDDLNLYSIKDNCEVYVYSTSNKGFWWPIGSKEETASNIYGGAPTSTHISSYYGMRIHPKSGEYKMHNGIDIDGGCDQVIIATKSGEITDVVSGCEIGGCDGYGNYVIIKHADEMVSVYAHMKTNSATINVGDTVAQGQKIGLVGNTGTSTGCHLHFEIRDNGTKKEPLDYVSTTEPRIIIE